MLNLSADQCEVVVALVLDAVGGTQADIVFMAGSMVDSLANARSDLDVYVIATDDGATGGIDVTMRGREYNSTVGLLGGREVNMSVLTTRALAELSTNFRPCLDALGDERGVRQLDSENDLKLLHRIRTGQPLQGGDGLGRVQTVLQCDRLSAYLVNVSAVTAANRLADVAGEVEAGNTTSAVWMLREAAVCIGQCALAVAGETNPSRKWLVRLLERPGPEEDLRRRIVRTLVHPSTEYIDLSDLRGDLRTLIDNAPEGLVSPYTRRIVCRRA